ncbi:MAG: TetR/AcrR family transcriptional regulator [Caulobacteraceae bacterium]
MGRRSDHTRSELKQLFVEEGRRQLSEAGLAAFSARDVAKRVGYSIGTVYNVFGSYDGLILAMNARTLELWMAHLKGRLAQSGEDRIACMVHAYFEFAAANPKTWIAIYEHHMADNGPAPDWYQQVVNELMAVVGGEIAAVLPGADPALTAALARSLVATVHGHCAFALYNTFRLLGETQPEAAALARVREALAAAAVSS